MASLDGYIAAAEARITQLTDMTIDAVNSIDYKKGVTGTSFVTVQPSDVNALFLRPNIDLTPFPVFDTPTVEAPVKPVLTELNNISHQVIPVAPVIDTSGLFNNVKPTGVIPQWNQENPNLHIDEIYQALVDLMAPVLDKVALPSIIPIIVDKPPELQLPSYSTNALPAELDAPVNYADYYRNKYETALPELKQFIDAVVDSWITRNAPEFYQQRDALNSKLIAGMTGQVLTDEFEDRLFSRSQAKVSDGYDDAEHNALDSPSRGVGFIIAPSSIANAIQGAKLAGAKALAGNAQEVWLERRRTEIQHLQFVMNIISSNVTNIRNMAVQYAQFGVSLAQEARTNTEQWAEKVIQIFEHQRSRGEFSLELLRIIDEQYKTKLTAALSGLEGFKAELEALRLTKDIDNQQIESAKLKLEAQQIEVNNYSAMVDAIAKRANVTDGYIKDIEVKARVFETTTRAVLSTYDIYKAANEGDRGKLEGLMAEVSLYEEQLKAIQTNVNVDVAILEGNVKVNDAKINQYQTESNIYKTLYDVALAKFEASAEIKKMGLDIYKTNVTTELAIWQGELEKQFKYIDEKLKAAEITYRSFSDFYTLEERYAELGLQQTTAIASGLSNVASASANALSGVISLAEQVL